MLRALLLVLNTHLQRHSTLGLANIISSTEVEMVRRVCPVAMIPSSSSHSHRCKSNILSLGLVGLLLSLHRRIAFYRVITWKRSPTAKLPRRKQIYLIGTGSPRNRAYATQATAGCSRRTSFIRWQRHRSVYSSDG